MTERTGKTIHRVVTQSFYWGSLVLCVGLFFFSGTCLVLHSLHEGRWEVTEHGGSARDGLLGLWAVLLGPAIGTDAEVPAAEVSGTMEWKSVPPREAAGAGQGQDKRLNSLERRVGMVENSLREGPQRSPDLVQLKKDLGGIRYSFNKKLSASREELSSEIAVVQAQVEVLRKRADRQHQFGIVMSGFVRALLWVVLVQSAILIPIFFQRAREHNFNLIWGHFYDQLRRR
jgi:hypothetical protein